jgi:cytochrome c oxidase cbb3-type subunit 3
MFAAAAAAAMAFGAFALPELASAEGKKISKGPRTVAVSTIRAGRGERIFAQQCAECHGDRAEGRLAVAPSLVSGSFLKAASDEVIMTMTRTRHDGTPFEKAQLELSPRDLEELTAFLRKTHETEPAVLDESPLRGDVENGSKVFARVCAICHGLEGDGYFQNGPAPAIGRKVFLSGVTNGYLRHIIKVGKSETKMRGFAEGRTVAEWSRLDDQEVEDVIAWLRSTAH